MPFGTESDFNATTVKLLEKHGYVGLLYSRGALNTGPRDPGRTPGDFAHRERYMVPSDFSGFQTRIARMFLLGLFRPVIDALGVVTRRMAA